MEQFERILPIIGNSKLNKLQNAHVAVFGIGGVGSYVVEALARGGVGMLTLIDNDNVEITNLNRQLEALHSTIGTSKVEAMKNRVLDINPKLVINTYKEFVTSQNIDIFNFSKFDYVVDAIDTVSTKIELIKKSKDANVQIISCMGTGNKLEPLKFKITDISKTTTCPLARVIRKELSKQGIKNVKVLYSTEEPVIKSKDVVSSMSYVPGVAGLMIAGEVIKDLIK